MLKSGKEDNNQETYKESSDIEIMVKLLLNHETVALLKALAKQL